MWKFQIFPRSIHGENPKNLLSELRETENKSRLRCANLYIEFIKFCLLLNICVHGIQF